MIRIERSGLQLRHGSAWLQQQGIGTQDLRQRLVDGLVWQQPLVTVYGKQHRTPRLTCWVADPGCSYRYSGLQQEIHPWTRDLETLRDLLQQQLEVRFNSLLLNRYRDGADRMGWHADDEAELDDQAPIASLSLGVARDLRFRPRRGTEAAFAVNLADGDLLVMDPPSQNHWQHALPPRARVVAERINLTFRVIRLR
ncbi:alpha-ketoglutarate-dependent dioxygenase AlkB [Synechococcus sp. LA31]|uniref:alpha-ketoglutarate-dependent dioxygenase AlkB family protein n=1 Tax=Synechococcus sp. LA31 TaxID=2741953 RepID=UPI001BDC2865|nr:alpha-ketoglutarate-dependent dioxygenase AlkB [Synechococcus sp. LA31]QVV68001.1 alpha-ketoglutarate-dependent dioxygenase AlkB [Synechococcus sp. LA31]